MTTEEMVEAGIGRVAAKPLSRRDALKKGAIAGGTVLWVTPVVQGIGMSQAFASHPSPVIGHGVSFVAFRFTCGTITYFAKLDFLADNSWVCSSEVNDPDQNSCGVDDAGAEDGCASGLYTVDTILNTDGEIGQVIVTLTCTDGEFDDYATKCGNAHGGCHDGHVSTDGQTATFSCPD